MKSYWLILIVSVVFWSGCAQTYRSDPVALKNQETSKKLIAQNQKLNKQNKKLGKRLNHLEKRLSQQEDSYGNKLSMMDRTINLLEKNLEDIQTKVAALPKPTASRAPDKNYKEVSMTEPATEYFSSSDPIDRGMEIETPEDSKAIETVSLIPNYEKSEPAKTRTALIIVEKSQPRVNSRTKPAVKKNPVAAAIIKDSDLTPPKKPIRLTGLAGSKSRYNEAYKTYSRKSYRDSIKRFQSFLARFPNDYYADNSRFWIGQSHYQLGNTFLAEQAFRRVLKDYPHGETARGYKTPDVILMLGKVYGKRGEADRARYYYQEVAARYPRSISAMKARRELQSMDGIVLQ